MQMKSSLDAREKQPTGEQEGRKPAKGRVVGTGGVSEAVMPEGAQGSGWKH
jgi:hypothetical protein